MLEKLHVVNWKCHEDTELVFGDGITTITGTSDVGKSALISALRWICLNQPSGDKFISWGKKECTGTLHVDGHIIERKRGRGQGVNTYTVDGQVLKAFGLGVPKEVTDILNMDPGGLNWQRQIESHLWFHERSNVIIGEINRLVDMSVIDVAVGRLSSQHRNAKVALGIYMDDMHKARAAYHEAAHIPVELGLIEAVLTSEQDYAEAAEDTAELRGLVKHATDASQRIATITAEGKLCQDVVAAGRACIEATEATAVVRRHIDRAKAALLTLCFGSPPDDAPLVLAYNAYTQAAANTREVARKVDDIRRAQSRIDYYTTELEALAKSHAQFKECPTCKRLLRS